MADADLVPDVEAFSNLKYSTQKKKKKNSISLIFDEILAN